MNAIEIESLNLSYGKKPMLKDVSISVGEGRWTGIIGPNGSGKSTLLRAVVGSLEFEGRINVLGQNVGDRDIRAMALKMAYVPQRPVYPQGMSVFDFVLLGRTPHLGVLAAEGANDIALVWESLEALSITSFASRDVSSLSGGETQRVSLARVLAQQPSVVLLDEATASLDVAAQHEVMELIADIQTSSGVTIFSAIHDLTAAAQFCDDLVLLHRGETMASGPPSSVLTEATLGRVFEPTIRVIDVEGSLVVVSLRTEGLPT
jgi:iron complex transport system ATP-binding protein